jgi:hypothetical protein
VTSPQPRARSLPVIGFLPARTVRRAGCMCPSMIGSINHRRGNGSRAPRSRDLASLPARRTTASRDEHLRHQIECQSEWVASRAMCLLIPMIQDQGAGRHPDEDTGCTGPVDKDNVSHHSSVTERVKLLHELGQVRACLNHRRRFILHRPKSAASGCLAHRRATRMSK